MCWALSTACCSHWLLPGFRADRCPLPELERGMNEWKSSTPFMAAKQLIFKCSPEPHPSTACWYSSKRFSCIPSTFFFFFLCMPLFQVFFFCFCEKAFSPQRQGHNSPVCREERDLSLLLSPKERIFHWRQGLCTQREGDKHIGGRICFVNENFAVGIYKPLTVSSLD